MLEAFFSGPVTAGTFNQAQAAESETAPVNQRRKWNRIRGETLLVPQSYPSLLGRSE